MKNLNFAMKEGEKIVYTGNRFKSFLKRNSISYKEAADTLGIDKNTVGKAVRGGNLNVDIILRICNVYDMDITDFFVAVGSDGAACDADYYNSISSEGISTQIVSEEDFSYKKCENFDERVKVVSDMIDHNQGMLTELSNGYNACRQMLNELLQMVKK